MMNPYFQLMKTKEHNGVKRIILQLSLKAKVPV